MATTTWSVTRLEEDRKRVYNALSEANKRYKKYVIPNLLNSGKYTKAICNENCPPWSDRYKRDANYGIDWDLIMPDGTTLPVMARVLNSDWITVRVTTRGFPESEYGKLLRLWSYDLCKDLMMSVAIFNEQLNKVTHVYWVAAYELFTAIKDGKVKYGIHKNNSDDNVFYSVTEQDLIDSKIRYIKKIL